jgi:hypothetical protein
MLINLKCRNVTINRRVWHYISILLGKENIISNDSNLFIWLQFMIVGCRKLINSFKLERKHKVNITAFTS